MIEDKFLFISHYHFHQYSQVECYILQCGTKRKCSTDDIFFKKIKQEEVEVMYIFFCKLVAPCNAKVTKRQGATSGLQPLIYLLFC